MREGKETTKGHRHLEERSLGLFWRLAGFKDKKHMNSY
jgi:hypothetical protein